MDRLIYVAMTGAKNIMSQQASVSHNLANATTDGFRAEIHRFRTAAVQGEGLPTRAFAVDSSIATDFSPGTLVQTGKIDPIPILLFGRDFWNRVVDFEALVEEGVIAPSDLKLISWVETAEEAWTIVEQFYSDEDAPGCE